MFSVNSAKMSGNVREGELFSSYFEKADRRRARQEYEAQNIKAGEQNVKS